MLTDEDLLAGAFAVQFGFATPQEIHPCLMAPDGQALADRLEALGVLAGQQRAILEQMVAAALQSHEGDSDAALLTFGGKLHLEMTMGASTFTDAATITPDDDYMDGATLDVTSMRTMDATTAPDFGPPAGMPGPPPTGLRRSTPTAPVPGEAPDESLEVTAEQPGRYRYRPADGTEMAGDEDKERAVIGRGGIGRVLLATDRHLRRDVALKELLPTLGRRQSTVVVARFLREARVTGQLEHPNIVPVYEVGCRQDGTLYYTMKLVRGRTLTQVLEDGETLEDRLKLLPRFVDACQAMAYAHSFGVVHRDIKPDNIMVGEFGETLVLDWGLAKVRGKKDLQESELERELRDVRVTKADRTLDGDKMGTPAYMAPEQAEGKIREIDERSDVWSLGAVLYQIITGKAPFSGRHPLAVIAQVVRGDVPDPATECEQAPPELVSICKKALTRDRDQRYARAAELADEVEAFQSGALVRAYEYGPWDLLRHYARIHRAPLLVAAVAAVLLTVLGVYSYRKTVSERDRAVAAERAAVEGRDRARAAEHLAEDREAYARRMLARAFVEKARSAQATGDHAAAQTFSVAALGHHDGPEARGLAIHAAGSRRAWLRWWTPPGAECLSLAWAPGGESLACATADGVRVWDPVSGEETALLQGAKAWVASVAFSPDGRTLAAGGHDRTIRLWDVAAGKETATLRGHEGKVWSVAFSPDGRLLASGAHDATVRLWDPISGKAVASLRGHERKVWSVSFSPDGRRLASASTDGSVRLWSPEERKEVARLEGHQRAVLTVVWSPDGRLLASSSVDQTVRLWDAETGASVATLTGHEKSVIPLVFTPDGRMLVSGSSDHSIRLWDVATKEHVRHLGSHDGWVWSLVVSPDGRTLVSSGRDTTVRQWDLASGEVRARLGGHGAQVTAAAFSADSRRLATAGADKTARVWDVKTGAELACFSSHHESPTAVAFSPDGNTLAVGSRDEKVWLWDLVERVERRRLLGHEGEVLSVAWDPRRDRVASGGKDGSVRVWDPETGEEVRRFDLAEAALGLAFSPDGKALAAGGANGGAWVWEAASGRTRAVRRFEAAVRGLSFAPDGGRLAVASGEHVLLWEPGGAGEPATLLGHGGPVHAVSWFAGGGLLASGGEDGTLRLWDPAVGKEVDRVARRAGALAAVAASPDGRWLAGGGAARTVCLWDAGAALRGALRHPPAPLAVAWTSDGETLASGGEDGSIRLWQAASGSQTGLLSGHEGPVWALDAGGDGLLASAGRDGHLRLWSPPKPEPRLDISGELGQLFGVALSSDGRTLAWSDGSIHLKSLPDGADRAGPWAEQGDPVRSLALSPDGRTLAAADWGTKVTIWDLARRRRGPSFEVRPPFLSSLAFSPDGGTLLTGSTEGTVVLRDAATGKERRRLAGLDAEVTWVGVSFDRVTLAAATSDGILHLWEVTEGRELARLPAHGGERIRGAAFSPGGRTLVTAGSDGVLRRWDLTLARTAGERLQQEARRTSGLDLSGVELQSDPEWRRTRFVSTE